MWSGLADMALPLSWVQHALNPSSLIEMSFEPKVEVVKLCSEGDMALATIGGCKAGDSVRTMVIQCSGGLPNDRESDAIDLSDGEVLSLVSEPS